MQALDTESYGSRGEERRGEGRIFITPPQERGSACRSQVPDAALMFFIRLQASEEMKGLWGAGVEEGYEAVAFILAGKEASSTAMVPLQRPDPDVRRGIACRRGKEKGQLRVGR